MDYAMRNNTWRLLVLIRVLYIAERDISKGEEITTSYGDTYFESRMT